MGNDDVDSPLSLLYHDNLDVVSTNHMLRKQVSSFAL